jgi:hypothetical protein
MISRQENPYDISNKLDSIDQRVYPLYSIAPKQWRAIGRFRPLFLDDNGAPATVSPEETYTSKIVFSAGRGEANLGIAEVIARPLTSYELAYALTRYGKFGQVAPYAPLGFTTELVLDDVEQRVNLFPAYFLAEVRIRKIPTSLIADIDGTPSARLRGEVYVGNTRIGLKPVGIELHEGSAASTDTRFLSNEGDEISSGEMLLLPHTDSSKNMSITFQRLTTRQVRVLDTA